MYSNWGELHSLSASYARGEGLTPIDSVVTTATAGQSFDQLF